jgi:hypothetical protein
MKKIFSSKKRVTAVGVLTAATLLGGGVAVAYWTSTGSGTGEATVGSAGDNISVSGSVDGTLSPGGPAATVSFTATNPENFSQKLTTIHLDSIDADDAGCATVLGTDFSMADVTVRAEEGELGALDADVDLTDQGTLEMLDSGVNQDDCQGATLTLNFTTS